MNTLSTYKYLDMHTPESGEAANPPENQSPEDSFEKKMEQAKNSLNANINKFAFDKLAGEKLAGTLKMKGVPTTEDQFKDAVDKQIAARVNETYPNLMNSLANDPAALSSLS